MPCEKYLLDNLGFLSYKKVQVCKLSKGTHTGNNMVKVDSLEVLTIFRVVGVSRWRTQLRYFTWLHCTSGVHWLKSISVAFLSQQPSPKNFLQIFLSLILTNLDQIHRDLLINTRKKKLQKILRTWLL